MRRSIDLGESYDRLAAEYARRFADELDHKPFDREQLTRFAERLAGRGPICDLGCGPGQITSFLAERGLEVFGLDLSAGMVAQARALNPGLRFRQGDMSDLAEASASLAGIVAFYSIIHIPRPRVVAVLCEIGRVLEPGGVLLLSFHLGDQELHLDELWGLAVNMDACFFEREEMVGYLRDAGFEIEEASERDPYPDVEYRSRRAYIWATRPRR